MLDVPDRIEQTGVETKNAYKVVGDRLLKVTYKEAESETVVITVIEKEITEG